MVKMKEFSQWSRLSLIIISLLCIVFGGFMLVVLLCSKPDVKKPLTVGERPLWNEQIIKVLKLYHVGQYSDAAMVAEEALAAAENSLGSNHPDIVEIINILAFLHYCCGEYEKAELLFQRALVIYEEAFGKDHPAVAACLNNLGEIYKEQGKYKEAMNYCERSLAIDEKWFGKDHPTIATDLRNLGLIFYSEGQYATAESFFRRALAIEEKALGPDHPDVAATLNNLAGLYKAQRRNGEAESLFQRALAIYEEASGKDHLALAATLDNLAGLYVSQGRYGDAEPLFQRVLALYEKAFGKDHPAVAATLNNLAGLYDSQRRYAEAEPFYERSLAIMEKAYGKDHSNLAKVCENLARFYREIGKEDEAERLEERVRKIQSKRIEGEPRETGTVGAEKLIVSKPSEPSMVIQAGGREEKVGVERGIEDEGKTPEEKHYQATVPRRKIVGRDAELREKIPTAIPEQKELGAIELQKKSVKEIPQSRPVIPETVELEKESQAAESTRSGTPKRPPVAEATEKLTTLRPAKALKGVSVKKRGGSTEVTITADGIIRDYHSFTLESPPRLVIDLLNLKNLFPKNVVDAGRAHLKRIRIGIHPKKTRLVLDFSGPKLPVYRINRFQKELVVLLGDSKDLAPRIKIMPLGDSITYGTGAAKNSAYTIGYRKYLWDSLKAAGYSIDFVGSNRSGWAYEVTQGFDPNHEGHGGWTDDMIAVSVYDLLVRYQPNVVLLHIGTNGLDQSPGCVEDILDEIDRYSEEVTVILARIINRECCTFSPPCLDCGNTKIFNDRIQAMAMNRIAKGDKIIIVDMEKGAGIDYRRYPHGDMYDNLHPSATGYAKMAKVWLKALKDLLPADEKIARREMKVKGEAFSLVETSSPLVKSETSITTNNSSNEGEGRVIQTKQPSLIAKEEEVSQFFVDYVERYNQKDINGFLSLFSPKAIQNQRDGFDEIKKTYSDFFDQSQELRYHIDDMRMRIYQYTVYVIASYKVDQILKKEGKRGTWRGDISWILVRENGDLKISSLDYRHQKSP